MLVPDNQQQQHFMSSHVISMYLATCGANGFMLGSDEKEIIYLVFGIIDLKNKEIIGIKQYLVRPIGLQCSNNNNNNNINNNVSKSTATSSNTSTTSSENGSIASTSYIEPLIPDNIVQSAGRALSDVINDFDSYLRSLKIDQNSICLVTDGQLPLRQCLLPECCAKDIHLPSYYWKFSDLKKEYLQVKTTSPSIVAPTSPTSPSTPLLPTDVMKLPNIPSITNPIMIADIISEMELQPYVDNDFYIKESRDMITIVQSMLNAGHMFIPNEVVNQTLEPGICSIDDEIDGNCIVRARGLPWQSSDQDIAKFFRGLNVAKGGVALCLSAQGRRNGEALIRFVSQEHRDMALKRHKHHIGSRYIEVYRATGEDFLAVAGGASNEAQAFLSKGAQVIIRMRGLPYDCTAIQVLEFFANGEKSCKVLDDSEGILFVKKPDGRSTGDAFVLFSDESDAPKALSKHRELIGQRYIELFRSTIAEVQQVLNRSMDPKTYENATKPPLIAQIPQSITQMPMLPQHVITSGTEKNCIRLRGLPYEAKVEHILTFLEDFSKHIVYQGVHLVYNAQGQFNGEAFIQMDSEQAAHASAQQKHHKHMMFGKKQRYIEVFQCSGDDMNLVLQGGYQQFQTAPTINAKPHPSGNSMLTPTFAPFNQFIPSPPIYSSPPQIFYWTGYGPGPISPTYIQPLPIPPHAFHHFSPDRPPALFPEMEVEMQPPPPPQQIINQPPPQQHPIPIRTPPPMPPISPATAAQQQQLPNQVKVTTNFNFQYDDNGNLGRVDVSKALCYQSQEIANNVLTKNVLVMHQKKAPILISSSPNGEQSPQYEPSHSPPQQQQQHLQQVNFIDCNNNLNIPQPTPTTVIEAQQIPQPIFAPKTVNGHFHHTIHQPTFINWSHPQFQ